MAFFSHTGENYAVGNIKKETHQWQGRTVIPFCAHEGSGLSDTEQYIADNYKEATVEKGLAIRDNTAQNK